MTTTAQTATAEQLPTPEQIDRFGRDGYLVVPGALPAARVAELRAVVGRLEERLRESPQQARRLRSRRAAHRHRG